MKTRFIEPSLRARKLTANARALDVDYHRAADMGRVLIRTNTNTHADVIIGRLCPSTLTTLLAE
jgi:hypothetical protein